MLNELGTPRRWGKNQLMACLVILAALLCSGCTGKLPTPDLSEIPLPWRSSIGKDVDSPDALTLLVWDEGQKTETLRNLIKEFQSKSPEVAVELVVSVDGDTDLSRQLDSDHPPDLILVDSFHFPDLVVGGVLANPQNRLDSNDDFYPTLTNAFRYDGTLYCLPREVRTLALIYDRVGFIGGGLEPPTTWDEVRQAAEALSDPDTGSFGLIVSPDLSRWLPFLYQAGGQLIGADGHMDLESTAAATALDFYISVFRENFAGQPAESNSRWAGEVLGKRKGSMTVEGNWVVPYFAAQFPGYAYGVASLPSGPGGRGTVAFTSCYAVTAQSDEQNSAFALANFLTSSEAMRRWPADGAFMPTRFSLRDSWLSDFPALAPFMNGIDEARVWQLPPGFDTFLRTFNRNMVELFAADIEAADLRFEMQRIGEVLLNQLATD